MCHNGGRGLQKKEGEGSGQDRRRKRAARTYQKRQRVKREELVRMKNRLGAERVRLARDPRDMDGKIGEARRVEREERIARSSKRGRGAV